MQLEEVRRRGMLASPSRGGATRSWWQGLALYPLCNLDVDWELGAPEAAPQAVMRWTRLEPRRRVRHRKAPSSTTAGNRGAGMRAAVGSRLDVRRVFQLGLRNGDWGHQSTGQRRQRGHGWERSAQKAYPYLRDYNCLLELKAGYASFQRLRCLLRALTLGLLGCGPALPPLWLVAGRNELGVLDNASVLLLHHRARPVRGAWQSRQSSPSLLPTGTAISILSPWRKRDELVGRVAGVASAGRDAGRGPGDAASPALDPRQEGHLGEEAPGSKRTIWEILLRF
jgi:hypothetical protein